MAFTFLEDAPVGVTFLDDEPATGVTFLDEPVEPVAPAPQSLAPSFTATMPVKIGQPIGTPQDFTAFDPNKFLTAPDSPAPSRSVDTGLYKISYAKAAPTNAVPALNPINGEWTPEVIASQNARADEFNPPTESALRERSYNEALNPLFQLTQGPLKPQAPRKLTEDEWWASQTPRVEKREVKTLTGEIGEGNIFEAIGVAYKAARESLTGILPPTEEQILNESVPWGTNPDGSVKYEYKPLGIRLDKTGIMTPLLETKMMGPKPDDTSLDAAGKATFNFMAGLVNFGLSPLGIATVGLGAATGATTRAAGFAPAGLGAEGSVAAQTAARLAATARVASGGFAIDMASAVPEQYKAATESLTLQGRIEGFLGVVSSLAFATLAAKHAAKKPLELAERQNLESVVELAKRTPDAVLEAVASNMEVDVYSRNLAKAELQRRQIEQQAALAPEAAAAAESAANISQRKGLLTSPDAPDSPASARRRSELKEEPEDGLTLTLNKDRFNPPDPAATAVGVIKTAAAADAAGKPLEVSIDRELQARAAWYELDVETRNVLQIRLQAKLDKNGVLTWEDVPADILSKIGTSEFKNLKDAMAADPQAVVNALTPTPAKSKTLPKPTITEPLTVTTAPVAEVEKTAADKEALRQAGVGGMGGAERDAMEARLKASATSNKESVVNQERATQGFDPVTKEEKIKNIATLDNAEAVLEQNPNKGSEIVARLTSENPQERTISLQDGAVMLVDRSKLKSQREDAANRSVDPELSQLERNVARITYSEIDEKIRKLDEAAQDARSTWGRFGQFWQQMLRDDFTFDALRRKIEAAKGERLDPNSPADAIVLEKLKEDAAKHEAEAAVIAEREKANVESNEQKHRISELENLLTEAGKKPAKAAAKERIPNDYAPNKPFGEKVIAYADAKAAEALIRIRQKIGGQLGSAPDPTILADAAIYGAAKLTKGSVKFTQWSLEMAAEVGNWIKPYAKELWEQSKVQVESMMSEAPRDIIAERKATLAGLKEATEANLPKSKLYGYARALAKQFIDEGITKMEDIDAAVHAELQKVIPEITVRESGTAWTGYGEWKPASIEPTSVTLANVTGERRAALKLEGVRDLDPPEVRRNTGQGRQPPTAQTRMTEKEAARIEKQKNLKSVDPEKAHKTALESVKNNLRNRLEELKLAMATRKRINRDKIGVERDTEAKDLQDQLDVAQKDYDQVFPKEPITIDEQLRRSAVIAERNAAEWEKRTSDAKKGIFKTSEKSDAPINQRIQAANDQAAAYRAEATRLRDLDSSISEAKTQAKLDSAGERLGNILDNGEKAKPSEKQGPVTAATSAKQARNAALRKAIEDARELSGETGAKRAEAIGRALDKEIAKVSNELETNTRRAATTGEVDTVGNEQKRSELAAMRDFRKELDKVAGKTIDEKKLDSLVKRRDVLQKEVDSGKIDPKTGRPTANTAEQAKIQREIDALNARKAQLREDANPKTPENIRELQDIQDRIDAAKDRLARGQIEPETGKPTVRDQAQTEALAELKTINDTIAQMRRQASPSLSPAMKNLRAERARLTRSIADKTMRRFTDQFEPEAKAVKPVPLTPEEIKADMELNTLRAEHKRTELRFKQAEEVYKRKNRTTSVKIFEGISEWSRTAILAGAKVIGKLTSAAAEIIAAAPIEQAVGAAVSKILPRSIRDKATTRSQFSIDTEIKAVTETFRNFIKDAKDAFKTGNTDLDLLYGDPRVMPPELKNYLGNMHYALKSPAARNAWVRYFEYQMKSEAKASARRGEVFNPRDPMTQLRVGQEAYKRAAKPSIFSEDNVVTNTYKAALGYLGKIKNERGEPMFSAQILKTAADFSLPIVKIPTNIVARIFEYSFGTLMAPARIGNAGLRGIFMEKKATGEFNLREGFRKGLEDLKPEEADLIIRNLARGSLGATLLAIGFVMPNSFGGYYSRGQKRNDNDVEFGGMRFYGVDVPRWMVHNPLIEQVQIGATLRRVANSKLRKSDNKTQAFEAGALAAYLGVLEEAPMVSEMLDIAAFRDKPDAGSIGGGITGRFVPQFIKETARALDKDSKGKLIQREPQNQWERFEMNFPYLRTRVKKKQIKQRR